MKRFGIVAGIWVCSVFGQEKIGAVYLSKESEPCLLIKNNLIKRNAVVDLVGGNSRLHLGQAIVDMRMDSCNESKDDPQLYLYRLRMDTSLLKEEIEIVAFLKPILERTKDSTELLLRGQKQGFELYQCASSEGVHLFVRKRRDHSKILWHRYIYFDFELEGNCKESDFAGLNEDP